MKALKRIGVLVLCVVFCLQSAVVYADSQRIVTLGNDLSEEQKNKVLEFFGSPDLSSVNVIIVTNEDERKYLDGVVSSDIIGTHTYSCAYIEPVNSGGINVKTANLTYVTCLTLKNALMTAGVENCNLVVTAPFEVSGTGALTGVFMAYESTGEELDEGKKELASEELIVTADLENKYGETITGAISEAKEEVVSRDEDLSDEQIEGIVDNITIENNITLSSEEISKLVSFLSKIQDAGYDSSAFTAKIDEIADESKGFFEKIWDAICNFFSSIMNFFTGGDDKEEVKEPAEGGIFEDINTDIIEYDEVSGDSVENVTPDDSTESIIEQETSNAGEGTEVETVGTDATE